MRDKTIKTDGADAGAPRQPSVVENREATPLPGVGMEGLSAGDYCHLAEECFVLAAVAKDPDAAAELLKRGDDYLRCAAGWVADQVRGG